MRLTQQRDEYQQALEAELAGNAELRRRHGARDDETMAAFIGRLTTERNEARVKSACPDCSGTGASCGETDVPGGDFHGEGCRSCGGTGVAQDAAQAWRARWQSASEACDAARAELEALRRILPPSERGQGIVGEGSWAVYAEKVTRERDDAREAIQWLAVSLSECVRELREHDCDYHDTHCAGVLEHAEALLAQTGGDGEAL